MRAVSEAERGKAEGPMPDAEHSKKVQSDKRLEEMSWEGTCFTRASEQAECLKRRTGRGRGWGGGHRGDAVRHKLRRGNVGGRTAPRSWSGYSSVPDPR